ncbi:MAG: hypothetical protein IJV06_05555 [Bacteroidaceae bacterium]|nr:hypothetical protein [Bacteroidaceae bacterium]
MRKTFTLLAAMCMTISANSKILRVSNLEGSSAPYPTIGEAMGAAADGDTIMVDGSNLSYGSLKGDDDAIKKRVVIMGPGYWLTENEKTDIGAASAIIDDAEIYADEVQICGMYIDGKLTIDANKVVVNRCRIQQGIKVTIHHENIIIHQNAISGGITGDRWNNSNGIFPPVVAIDNVQITNNIFMDDPSGSGRTGAVSNFNESVIANNTWTESLYGGYCVSGVENSTIKNNIMYRNMCDNRCDGSTSTNNIGLDYDVQALQSITTDLDVQNNEILKTNNSIGAFAGDDPYVISGIPTGTVIEDLVIPASVREGEKLNITIKLGVSR